MNLEFQKFCHRIFTNRKKKYFLQVRKENQQGKIHLQKSVIENIDAREILNKKEENLFVN